MTKENIPVFPNIIPSSIKESVFRIIEPDDIQTEQDLQHLISLLFHEPECNFYYFVEKDGKQNSFLSAAKDRKDILMNEVEFFYYKHPKFERDYIHIENRNGKYNFEWEKEVVDRGPMYLRIRLQLSERKKRDLEILQKVKIEDAIREHRKESLNKYDVFLSYASVDRQEAITLCNAILEAGGKAFVAEKDIRPGDDFADKIRIALCNSRELWLLVSPQSIKSDWVISEWGAAWALEKKIIPILHRCAHDSLPDRLRRLQCIDYYKYPELIKHTFARLEESHKNKSK